MLRYQSFMIKTKQPAFGLILTNKFAFQQTRCPSSVFEGLLTGKTGSLLAEMQTIGD